ncbi:MAG: hypothetical protein AB7S67_04990, partial [Thiomonas sp.]
MAIGAARCGTIVLRTCSHCEALAAINVSSGLQSSRASIAARIRMNNGAHAPHRGQKDHRQA